MSHLFYHVGNGWEAGTAAPEMGEHEELLLGLLCPASQRESLCILQAFG